MALLTLAAPVVVWGGWQFHRAAAINLRHGAATMDTLVSVGTIAALGWSLYALFFGAAEIRKQPMAQWKWAEPMAPETSIWKPPPG